MKIINQVIIFILVFTGFGFAQIEDIEKILQKPEKQIDVGYACLVLSKDAFPDIDIKQGMQLFDNMAKGVEKIIEYSKDKTKLKYKRIGALNTFLYRPGPWNAIGNNKNMVFSYDDANIEHIKPQSLFIPYMIFEHKGTCSTMPTLWYIIADRLGWPINAVRGPGHIWVRYRGLKQGNIEATSNGGFIPDSQYIKDMGVKKIAIKNGVYLKSLNRKEFLATLLVNNAFYCGMVSRDSTRAVRYLKLAIKYDPMNVEALSSLGTLTKDTSLVKKAMGLGLTKHIYSAEFYEKRKKSLQKKE